MVFQENASLMEKLKILSDAAKYDVACTSSGVQRKAKKGELGNTVSSGICHTFASDGRCVSLLKILFTNECIFNCKYCLNRSSNDVPRASFTPEEVCTLTMEFYRRNYIEGLFLSSGILQSPDYTMELICKTLRDLREVHHFNGYIHCKAIPGAAPELVEMAGWYADRMSVNLEFPTGDGLKNLAPNKTRKTILTPMRQIQNGMSESRKYLGMKGGNQSAYWHTRKRMDRLEVMRKSVQEGKTLRALMDDSEQNLLIEKQSNALSLSRRMDTSRGFVPAGQSTQMIVGATGESDYQIMAVTQALYRNFDLKRVFYSSFINVNQDATLPALHGKPSLLREHRLYQADWLLRYYGFEAEELLSEEKPNFNVFLDPKCDWALRHMENYPVEINKADINALLRVPGIGIKSARRIVKARVSGKVDFLALKKMGVVLKRAVYFITCDGKMMYDFLKVEEDYITKKLVGNDRTVLNNMGQSDITYHQLTLLEDFHLDE